MGCHSDSGSASASRPFTGGGGSESFSAAVPDPFLLPDLGLGAGAAAGRDCARASSRVFSCVVSVPVNALRTRRGTGPGDGSVVRRGGTDRPTSIGWMFSGRRRRFFSGVSRPDGRRGTTAATRGFETAEPTPRRDGRSRSMGCSPARGARVDRGGRDVARVLDRSLGELSRRQERERGIAPRQPRRRGGRRARRRPCPCAGRRTRGFARRRCRRGPWRKADPWRWTLGVVASVAGWSRRSGALFFPRTSAFRRFRARSASQPESGLLVSSPRRLHRRFHLTIGSGAPEGGRRRF